MKADSDKAGLLYLFSKPKTKEAADSEAPSQARVCTTFFHSSKQEELRSKTGWSPSWGPLGARILCVCGFRLEER